MTNAPTLLPTLDRTGAGTDLQAWSDTIAALDGALREAAAARLRIESLHRQLECIEASTLLGIEGANAETRKARLTLALADDTRHRVTVGAIDAERVRLVDAERRITTAKERCRLLRASCALRADGD